MSNPPWGQQPQQPMQQPSQARPIMQFDSHVAGKNATVTLWPNRIEWVQGGFLGTGGKAALGAVTLGASLAATGLRGKKDTQTILLRSVSGVTTKKSGLTKTEVNVATPAGIITFRCSGSEASQFQSHLLNLIG